MWSEVALSLQQGNGYMLVMIALLFLSTVIIIERIIMLHFVFNINFSKFINNLRKMVTSNDLDRAINLCKSVRKTALPRIALRALEAAETDPTTVRGTIEEETIGFLPAIDSRLTLLPAIATFTMLIGILGTIDGLWGAFHSIEILDTTKKQASLATGIAASLNPTAMGLFVCMLVLAFHQLLKGSALRLTERIHHGVSVLNNILVPAEVVAYASAGQSASSFPLNADAVNSEKSDSVPSNEGDTGDEAFDDTSVEDIKDEEEII